MKKLILLVTMMLLSSFTFATLQDNENGLQEFIAEYQETATVEMLSRERPDDLDVTDIRGFFREKLNDYDE